MNRRVVMGGLVATMLEAGASGQESFDRLRDALTFGRADGLVQARLSGMLDLEGYLFEQPAPGWIQASGNTMVQPRLSLFVDSRIGSHAYLFVQARVDRGFDPADARVEARADEYALRLIPWTETQLNIQVGKFSTVVGGWVPRHLSWDNPFVSAPLIYENPTAVSDTEAPSSPEAYLERAGDAHEEAYEYNSVLWGPVYTSGASVSGAVGRWEAAAAIRNAPPSSRPESWSVSDIGFRHPSFEGRVGFRPGLPWSLGVSASDGCYFRPEAELGLPMDRGIGDYRQILVGQDVGYAWHHLQLWAEVFQARFEVPAVGNADTLGWYLEAKYKLAPQWFAAWRWNQQWFSNVPDGDGGKARWGDDTWRIDTGLGYRATAHTQIKVQHYLKGFSSDHADAVHAVAIQLTLRF